MKYASDFRSIARDALKGRWGIAVLAGLIAGLFAQGYNAEQSAILGVLIHSTAAKNCALDLSEQAMLPSDLETYICKLFADK